MRTYRVDRVRVAESAADVVAVREGGVDQVSHRGRASGAVTQPAGGAVGDVVDQCQPRRQAVGGRIQTVLFQDGLRLGEHASTYIGAGRRADAPTGSPQFSGAGSGFAVDLIGPVDEGDTAGSGQQMQEQRGEVAKFR